MTSRTLSLVARGVTSVALFVALGFFLEPRDVMARLVDMDPAWIFIALLLSIAQVIGSAWRWRFTAGRLGLELPMPRAVSEYYLAMFLNQVLPGGVVGDVSRAWRHAREADTRASVQSVAFERLSGLIVMSVVAAVSALLLLGDVSAGAQMGLGLLILTGLGCALWTAGRARARPESSQLMHDLRHALLEGVAFPVQLSSSAAVVASYIAIFVIAGRAVRVDMSGSILVMLAGWGLREVAAATLWSAAGLTASDGVAVSVSYGLLVLVSSLPGAAILGFTFLRSGGPGRRRDPNREERAEPKADAPAPDARSRAG